MKKIPTLFEREYKDHKIIGITDKVYPGMEWVLDGEGIATEKIDGSCCAFFNGIFYKRYDAKPGRKIPPNAIPCCKPDPITGHFPHWVPVSADNPVDKWYMNAFYNFTKENGGGVLKEGTYEAIGPHFQGNPHKLKEDTLRKHGDKILQDVPRSFFGIKDYLSQHNIEGIVFWKDGIPQCKIKRSDFGFPWNGK